MSKDFFEVIAAKAGFAGEYEALTESEIAAAVSGAYSPGEEGVYKVVASRTIQLLKDSPTYIETFQTSAATVRVPTGAIATNDAEDGRFYFIKNSATATGNLAIQKSDGTVLITLTVGQIALVIHGDNDSWTTTLLTYNTTDKIFIVNTTSNGVPAAGTRYYELGSGVACSAVGASLTSNATLTSITITVNAATQVGNTYAVQLLSDPSGAPTVLATLSITNADGTYKTGTFSVSVTAATKFGVRVVRTAGSGSSSWNQSIVIIGFTI